MTRDAQITIEMWRAMYEVALTFVSPRLQQNAKDEALAIAIGIAHSPDHQEKKS